MKIWKINIFFTIILSLFFDLEAQRISPMGSWRSHYNYEQAYLLTFKDTKVYASVDNGLIVSPDSEVLFADNTSLLSDTKISAIKYDATHDRLIIGYASGNIDVYDEDGLENYRALIDSDVVVETKNINDISTYNNQLNLSTSFGLLVLDLETEQIRDAYRNLGENGEILNINNSVILGDEIYLASSEGVLNANLASGDNLQDFANWNRYIDSDVYKKNILMVALWEGQVYAMTDSVIYALENNNWNEVYTDSEGSLKRCNYYSDRFYFIRANGLYQLQNSTLELVQEGSISDAIYLENIGLVVADSVNGFVPYDDYFNTIGPSSSYNSRIKVHQDTVFTFPNFTAQNQENTEPISYLFEGWEWTNIETQGFDKLTDYEITGQGTWLSSYDQGLLELKNQIIYDDSNSPLASDFTGLKNINENLWIANRSSSPLVMLDPQGNFNSYELGFGIVSPKRLFADAYDQLWMPLNNGVLGFDTNTTNAFRFTVSNSSLPSGNVNDIAIDREGLIWFATDLGIAYLPYSYDVVNNPTDLIIPNQFNNQRILAIEVDGGNRKWVATSDGVRLMDMFLDEEILYFNAENSPLPTNEVSDIAIHPKNGMVFFTTENGIVSFRSDATEATHKYSDVKVFPNPVTRDFEGWVGIEGLAYNSNVRITTVSGRLVKEIHGNGGSASWDIRDFSGRRVDTGVYLVFSANQDGSDTFVGKIAVID